MARGGRNGAAAAADSGKEYGMSWTVRQERIPLVEQAAFVAKLESKSTVRNIQCDTDPEHTDQCICGYQEFIEQMQA